MNKKIKVLTMVGTRPELIKLSAVIKKLDLFTDHILVHTGQNYDYNLNNVFFADLNIREPDYFLEISSSNFAYSMGKLFERSYDIMIKETPDALLVYGDTNSCLSVIVAKRLKIPIFHMEAGNRCFDENVPEELNRRIIDHVSDINLPISEHARDYLISEGRRPEQTIKIGSSMTEVLNNNIEGIKSSKVLADLNIAKKSYFLVSLHREENVDSKDKLIEIINILNSISQRFNKTGIFAVHPRTKARIEDFGLAKLISKDVQFLEPFGFNDYVHLQMNSFCVVSDSGTISEESSILDFPAITLRTAHERPEAMEEGTVIMTGINVDNVINSIEVVTSNDLPQRSIVKDYSPNTISDKVLKIILSYTGYINSKVWRKY